MSHNVGSKSNKCSQPLSTSATPISPCSYQCVSQCLSLKRSFTNILKYSLSAKTGTMVDGWMDGWKELGLECATLVLRIGSEACPK